MLYTWFLLTFLLALFLLIARFYQKFASERTYFQLYGVSIALFGGALVHYASQNRIAGDYLGDLFLGASGLVLGFLSVLLYHLMTRKR